MYRVLYRVSNTKNTRVSCIVSSIERYGLPDMYRTYRIYPVGTLDPDSRSLISALLARAETEEIGSAGHEPTRKAEYY